MGSEILIFLNRHKMLILKASLPMALILLLGLAFLLVGYNLQQAAQGLEERFALEIFMRNDTPRETVDSLKYFLRHQPAYERIETVTQKDALDRMSGILGEDPTDVLGYNPLPMSIVFYPTDSYKTRTYLEILKKQVEENPGVEKAVFAGEWLAELERFNSMFIRVSSAFILLVLGAYILLFHMTLSHLWLKHSPTASKLHLMGMPRLKIRMPIYVWSMISATVTIAASMIALGVISSVVSERFLSLVFFEPRHVASIIIVFILVTLLMAVLKPMKIRSYE